MGNTTNLILIMLTTYLICGIVAISIANIDPNSNLLLSNNIFNPENNYILTSGATQGTITYEGANSIQYTQPTENQTGITALGSNLINNPKEIIKNNTYNDFTIAPLPLKDPFLQLSDNQVHRLQMFHFHNHIFGSRGGIQTPTPSHKRDR